MEATEPQARRGKPVMLLDSDLPRVHTIVINSRGENVSERFMALVRDAAAGDVMARVRAQEMAKDGKQIEKAYFRRMEGGYACHPVTWRNMTKTEQRMFRRRWKR